MHYPYYVRHNHGVGVLAPTPEQLAETGGAATLCANRDG